MRNTLKVLKWPRRRIGKISWIDRVKNEEVLDRLNEDRHFKCTKKRGEANRIGLHLA